MNTERRLKFISKQKLASQHFHYFEKEMKIGSVDDSHFALNGKIFFSPFFIFIFMSLSGFVVMGLKENNLLKQRSKNAAEREREMHKAFHMALPQKSNIELNFFNLILRGKACCVNLKNKINFVKEKFEKLKCETSLFNNCWQLHHHRP